MAKCFLIVGAPGSGKGTQAGFISELLNIISISTGDIFRKNISESTDLGIKIKEIVNSGQLVSDDLTHEVITERLKEKDVIDGFLLDGYPRNIKQLALLDDFLSSNNIELSGVIVLNVYTEEVVKRLLQRAKEQGRLDDTEEIIRKRQTVYQEETSPILSVYRDRGIVFDIDGTGNVSEISARIKEALKK